MPEKKNGSQEGRPASLEGASWDTNHMIWNARSLQRVVNTLERNPSASPQSDLLLFNGKGLAQAILLSLATEIALKALLCLERKKDPPRIHDLLKLFEQLEPDTQKVLRAEMPGWPWSVSTAAYSPAPNTWPIATRTPNRRGASFRASWTSNLPWKSPFPSFAARTAPGPAGSPTRASTGSWAFSTSATGDFPIRGPISGGSCLSITSSNTQSWNGSRPKRKRFGTAKTSASQRIACRSGFTPERPGPSPGISP